MESLLIAGLVAIVLAVIIARVPIDPTLKFIGQLLCGIAIVVIAFKLLMMVV